MPPSESTPQENMQKSNRHFLNERNQSIYCYYWKSAEAPKALLLLSHGFTEHSMMYDALAQEMARKRFFVFSHDHAGHGKSEGPRAFFDDVHHLVEDSVVHIKMIREEYPNLPLFVCGHSMGGAVSILLSLEKEVQLSGMVLIAPALAAHPETASFFRISMAKIMSKIIPHCPLAVTDFKLTCQNDKKVEEMYQDPLRFKGWWKARPVCSLLGAADEIHSKASEITTPFLLLQGDTDKVCHMDGATKMYENAKAVDKTLKIYPGAYHSLLNEPDEIADDVFEKTVQWLESKV